MRRRSPGTEMPRRASVSSSPSRLTAPASGASSPEITLVRVLLPLPERPKSAMAPGVGAVKVASRRNPASCFSTDTSSTSAAEITAHAPHEQLRREQPEQAEREGQDGEPQRERVSARGLHGGVQRKRQRARHSGHVGGKGNDRAELAEPGGECGKGSREDPREHEGKGDRNEAVERCSSQGARGILE